MNKLYGSIIIFFYFLKYPVVVFVPVAYLILDFPYMVFLDVIWIISFLLILKDILFPQKKFKQRLKDNIIAKVISIQVGNIITIDDNSIKGKQWSTGSYKKQVTNLRDVTFTGIEGDEVFDTKHHGGIDKAIFANALSNYPKWEKYLKVKKLQYGSLSENLTISNIDENEVCIGDIHQIGTVILEVSQPREPCWKISKKHNNKSFTKYIYKSGQTGWYYRVLQEGQIQINNEIILLKRINNAITIAQANKIIKNPKLDIKLTDELLKLNVLSNAFKQSVEKIYYKKDYTSQLK